MTLVNQYQNQKKIKKNENSSIERIHGHELSIQDKGLVNCLCGDCYEDLDFKKNLTLIMLKNTVHLFFNFLLKLVLEFDRSNY